MEEARMKCPTCGAEFPAGARFCPKCGYVVPVTTPVNATEPVLQRETVYVQPVETASGWAPWIAVLAIGLLVAGGIAMWNMGYFNHEPSTTYVAAPEPQSPPAQVTINERQSPAPAPDVNVTIPPASPAPPVATPPSPPLEMPAIVAVSGKTLATGTAEWRYGYTFKLRNESNANQTVNVKLTFLDGAGNPVDDTVMRNILVPANTAQTYHGEAMVAADIASRIKTVRAEYLLKP